MAEPDFSGVFESQTVGGEMTQEVTAPAQSEAKSAHSDSAPEGVTEREVTAPEKQNTENEKNLEKKNNGQTKEENAKYAAARRKAERDRDRMIDQARKEARSAAEKEADQMISAANMVNPYTKTPIRSKADFLAWQKQYDQENTDQIKNRLQQVGIDEKDVERLIENHPVVKEAKASLDQIRAAKEKAETAKIKATVDGELEKIRQWDGSVKSLADITRAENYQTIYEKVKKGYALADAYYLANLDKLNQQTVSKAEQSVLNHVRSKDHLAGTKARGTGDISVPAEVMTEFRRLMPNATAKEIRRYYQQDLAHLKK